MPSRSPLCIPTRLLVAISALMLQVVLQDRLFEPIVEWVHLVIAIALACAISRTEHIANPKTRKSIGSVCFAVLFLLPFLGDAVFRVFSIGLPMEIQVVVGLRNLMFGLAASRADNRGLKFASLASCFTALYSILWLMNGWNIALMLIYTLAGMWWLTAAYWSRISDCFLSHSERAIPWKPLCGTTLFSLLVLVPLFPLASGTSYTTALDGFMPSSGGSRWQDEHAFGGVGDGPQMVAAQEDASSFGPIESELFLESEMPSLYDCFNEFSEPPEKKLKKRKRIRAIPLAPSQMKQNHERKAKNQKPGREFEAMRKRKKKAQRNVDDLRSPALLQVVGRVPLHLGLYTYDLWDGQSLQTSNSAVSPALYFERRTGGKSWVRFLGRMEDAVLSHRENHQLRIINLKTDRMPAPPSLIGVHIDKIHTEKLFTSTQDGMLALDMDFIPQLSTIHVEALYRRFVHTPTPVQTDRQTGDTEDREDAISRLAKEWTADVPSGWQQVEAICRHLQNEYELDPQSMVPEDTDDAVVFFLTESRRGPDYLFAASGAMLLRSLGYESRVVSGFYASPKNYDRQARVTEVFPEDAHFWVEVNTTVGENDAGHWIPVDPSPGYEVLLAPETLGSLLLAWRSMAWQALKENPLAGTAIFASFVLLWLKKTQLFDVVITNWWRLRFRLGDTRSRVIDTLRLLERRSRIYGRPREKAISLSRWDLRVGQADRQSGARFLDVANWALYGSEFDPLQSGEEINVLCCKVAASAFRTKVDWVSTAAGGSAT